MLKLRKKQTILAIISALLFAGVAHGAPQNHGDKAFAAAKQFAQQHNLPHFEVNQRGVRRIAVNIPQNLANEWCSTFSKDKCYIEPFFHVSTTRHSGVSEPGWSYLRIGNKVNNQYGPGSDFYAGSSRVAFPISLTQEELATTEQKIRTSPNGPWSYNGGDPERTGRDCTNWVTYKIGGFTGVTTPSVKSHLRSLLQGGFSNRMTVIGVMTQAPVQDFGQEQLQINWDRH